jgi:hypothetical protein
VATIERAAYVDDAEPDRSEAVVEVSMEVQVQSESVGQPSAPLGDRQEHHRVLEGVESVA